MTGRLEFVREQVIDANDEIDAFNRAHVERNTASASVRPMLADLAARLRVAIMGGADAIARDGVPGIAALDARIREFLQFESGATPEPPQTGPAPVLAVVGAVYNESALRRPTTE